MTSTEQIFTTAGGFGGEYFDKCLSVSSDGVFNDNVSLNSNHEEADSRVWLHAFRQNMHKNILIVSPDTDTYHIGLPLSSKYFNQIHVQLHIQTLPGKNNFLHLNSLAAKIEKDVSLRSVPENLRCLLIQAIFIFTGCDFTSSLYGLSKQSFLKSLAKYCYFITGSHNQGHLYDFEENQKFGFNSFLRLIGCVYFDKYKSAFSEHTPEILLQKLVNVCDQSSPILHLWLSNIRGKVWARSKGEQNCAINRCS